MIPKERLPLWDQMAIRAYTPVCLCFPYDHQSSTQDETAKHIESALQRLAIDLPILGAKLELGTGSESGFAFLDTSSSVVPFEILPLEQDDVPVSYAELKVRGFPAAVFVNPRLVIDGALSPENCPLPAVRVRASFIAGGLLLFLYLHHSLGDGECMRMFIEAFAAQTRHSSADIPGSKKLIFSNDEDDKTNRLSANTGAEVEHLLYEMMMRTPEYCLLPAPTGPMASKLLPDGTPLSAIHKSGKLFVFTKDRLEALRRQLSARQSVSKHPSIYTCLAALTWAHMTKARTETESFVVDDHNRRGLARLFTPVSWRGRCFLDNTRNYFGNTFVTVPTELSVTELLAAAGGDIDALASVIQRLNEGIRSVDQTWVQARNAMFEHVDDPRRIGLDLDPRRPQDLVFNTWRYFGSDAEWNIPGVGRSTKPDVIRRIQGGWSMARAAIMPARAGSEIYELLVHLPVSSMEALCSDGQWLRFVDKILD